MEDAELRGCKSLGDVGFDADFDDVVLPGRPPSSLASKSCRAGMEGLARKSILRKLGLQYLRIACHWTEHLPSIST